jgi:hypothetical protein
MNDVILAIATQIRALLANLRDINNLSFRVALQTALMKLPAAIELVPQRASPLPGHVTVNSMWR